MQQRTRERDWAKQGDAQDDVRQVADGRVGEPPLQVVVPQREHGADQQRDRGEHHDERGGVHVAQ